MPFPPFPTTSVYQEANIYGLHQGPMVLAQGRRGQGRERNWSICSCHSFLQWPWVGDIPLLGFSSHQPSPGSCQAVLPYCSYLTPDLWMITTPQQLLPQNAELSLVGFTLILLNLCDLFSKFLVWVCHLFLARILTDRIKIVPKNKWLIQENMDWGNLKNTFYSNNSKETES